MPAHRREDTRELDPDFVKSFIEPLEAACSSATAYVTSGDPVGPYGGVYVVQHNGSAKYKTLPRFFPVDHDDLDRLPVDLEPVAHVQGDGVYAVGAARNYLKTDGTVNRSYFSG